MGIADRVRSEIQRSRELISGRGWDASRYGRHYVSAEDLSALAQEMVKGVPPHIARTRKISVDGVEVRSYDVVEDNRKRRGKR